MITQYLLCVSYEGEMEYGIYSSLEKALEEGTAIVRSAPYFDFDEDTVIEFALDTMMTGDLMHIWEDAPLRVEIRPMTLDKPIEEE
jgi:hypothetical protein